MKFPRRIEGSICGTGLLLRRPAPGWQRPTTCTGIGKPRHWSFHTATGRCPRPRSKICLSNGAQFFTVSYPRQHANANAAKLEPSLESSQPVSSKEIDAKNGLPLHEDLDREREREGGNTLSKQDLLDFVGTYNDDDTADFQMRLLKDPYLRGYAAPNGPDLSVSSKKEDSQIPSFEEVTTPNKEERTLLWKLWQAIIRRRRNPLKVEAQYIYHLYCQLPEPRMAYLHSKLRHGLLRSLSYGEKPSAKAMLRYFAVIADVKECGYALLPVEWNMALHLATKHLSVVTEAQVESGLNIWREMEHQANIAANGMTFNILFDSATKAGNFALAEMVYAEMVKRGHSFTRYHHVSLIFFFGLKMESDGVRAAYREMVTAGEIIDNAVLNCVIAAFLRCGEEVEALELYERMKASVENAVHLPAQTDMTQKAVTRVMMMFARVARRHPAMRKEMQAAASLAPDLRTYRILIRHFAINVGRIDKVAKFLNEMRHFQIPVHGGIFLSLFKGFALHGAKAGSDWSPQRLFSVWEAFLQAIDGGADGLYVDTWLALWILRAFEKCGQREMIMDIYEDLRDRWNLPPDRADFMLRFLQGQMKRLGLRIDAGPEPGEAFLSQD
ncbi:hypothetical protein MCOR27_011216 [Pyricularia oryzae]|nr:hypothetical protein MCOR01_003280 [Pyricularia oryzae]KAI6252323.1 hypothetical protein MCOR19_011063 [Pyricularia oryzae]KAI6265932.1 hypothetical protein MCOR27_011216 [Pyricularia oryzae]KAI6302880.1 hypothetical protein MCOR34_008903 [Pyricularia oryzae]KAI6303822.1 hypothetical protein MCOR29_010697 [Pyricularia oryzae]